MKRYILLVLMISMLLTPGYVIAADNGKEEWVPFPDDTPPVITAELFKIEQRHNNHYVTVHAEGEDTEGFPQINHNNGFAGFQVYLNDKLYDTFYDDYMYYTFTLKTGTYDVKVIGFDNDLNYSDPVELTLELK